MKSISIEDTANGVKSRATTVRLRAWLVTAIIIVGLILYTFIVPAWGGQPDYISLCLIAILQIVMHIVYFGEGENFGANGKEFVNNKKAYNEKATKVNDESRILQLREYCQYDYEERKKEYIKTELGAIGITEKEFSEIKQLTPKDVKEMKTFEMEGKLFHFTKQSRKRLYKLCFKPIPIEANTAEMIMNAVEGNSSKHIRDKSEARKTSYLVSRVVKSIPVAIFLAYIGYTMKDGVTFADVVRIFTFMGSLIVTSITSFIHGEENTKVYKNEFYIELSTFIDSFFEWVKKKEHKIEVKSLVAENNTSH